MSIEISSSMDGSLGVLELTGKLTLSPQLHHVREEARRLLTERPLRGLILMVSGIESVDSAGLGELTIVYSASARRGCGVQLVGVSPSFQKTLEITRLDAILTSSPDIESAKRKLAATGSG